MDHKITNTIITIISIISTLQQQQTKKKHKQKRGKRREKTATDGNNRSWTVQGQEQKKKEYSSMEFHHGLQHFYFVFIIFLFDVIRLIERQKKYYIPFDFDDAMDSVLQRDMKETRIGFSKFFFLSTRHCFIPDDNVGVYGYIYIYICVCMCRRISFMLCISQQF